MFEWGAKMSSGTWSNSIPTETPLVETVASRESTATSVLGLVGFAIVVFCVLFNIADFVGDKEENSLDFQVYLKLLICACAGIYGLWGALNRPAVTTALLSTPGLWMTCVGLFLLISVPFSVDRTSSMVAAVLFWTIYLMVPTVLHELGVSKTLIAIYVGALLFQIACWIAYLFFPTLGIFEEAIADGEFKARMAGISHPNQVGIHSGMLILLSIYFGLLKTIQWRYLVPVIMLAGAGSILCVSRTALAALMLSTMVAYWRFAFRPPFLSLTLIGIPAVLIFGMFLSAQTDVGKSIDSLAVSLTKSGDIEELLTATGRSEIWAFAIEKIGESPLFGKGLATSKVIMVDYSSYTHNLWLNVTFSAGIFCGLFMVILTLSMLRQAIFGKSVIVCGLVVFILTCGMFENTIISPIPGGPTIVFLTAMFIPAFISPSELETQEQLL